MTVFFLGFVLNLTTEKIYQQSVGAGFKPAPTCIPNLNAHTLLKPNILRQSRDNPRSKAADIA